MCGTQTANGYYLFALGCIVRTIDLYKVLRYSVCCELCQYGTRMLRYGCYLKLLQV
jgi:hypothetical protein